ncbi:hypothetical protein [Nocardia terpenica]|uniref:Uncharacterized protein n=1 Tax=Nocardia terpenica TaxID=455432 RepID=A0A6G9ZDD1_9NOCA|nr:hypothetical protein [Nocardia terpenica]QIS23629.1 hypothetical protein F6W96_40545 [Nocardia terpenica]
MTNCINGFESATEPTPAPVAEAAGQTAPSALPGTDTGGGRSAFEDGGERMRLIVRAAATASATEGVFVRRARRYLVLEPQYAGAAVVDYVVRSRDASGGGIGPSVSGAALAPDLSLPVLRTHWDREQQSGARREWRGARPPGFGDPDRLRLDNSVRLWTQALVDAQHWYRHLRSVSAANEGEWARIAARTAGVFAQWSLRSADGHGPFADVAAQLGISARPMHAEPGPGAQGRRPDLRVTAYLLAQMSRDTPDPVQPQWLLLEQLMACTVVIAKAHRARRELAHAAALAAVVTGTLDAASHRMCESARGAR